MKMTKFWALASVSMTFLFSSYADLNAQVGLTDQKFVKELKTSALTGASANLSSTKFDPRMLLGTSSLDNENMYNFVTDYCDEVDASIANEPKLRAQNLRRCKDGTVSFVQPPSEGWRGYEGKCGQTSASNVLFTLCRLAAHPNQYAGHYLSDLSPGVRTGTLTSGLNRMFSRNSEECPSGRWSIDDATNSPDFFDNLERGLEVHYNSERVTLRTRASGEKVYRKPVIAMIRNPGGIELHWVTVVDLIDANKTSCQVVINHWDDQFTVPCYNFARWSWGVGDSYGLQLSGYISLKFD